MEDLFICAVIWQWQIITKDQSMNRARERRLSRRPIAYVDYWFTSTVKICLLAISMQVVRLALAIWNNDDAASCLGSQILNFPPPLISEQEARRRAQMPKYLSFLYPVIHSLQNRVIFVTRWKWTVVRHSAPVYSWDFLQY